MKQSSEVLALSPCGSEPHRPRGLHTPVHVECLEGICVAETVTSSIVKGHCLLRDWLFGTSSLISGACSKSLESQVFGQLRQTDHKFKASLVNLDPDLKIRKRKKEDRIPLIGKVFPSVQRTLGPVPCTAQNRDHET